jgi:hypothetical protein
MAPVGDGHGCAKTTVARRQVSQSAETPIAGLVLADDDGLGWGV